jgi:DNA-binding transcriptional LysR family regulator
MAGISPHLMAQVEAGLLDAAVITQPPRHTSTNLMVHHLYTEPIALVAPKGMRCSGVADAMARAPYVAFDRSTWVGQAIDAFLLDHRIRIRPSMELNSQHAVLAVVRHGLGVSILPMLRGASQDVDGLRIMPIADFERGVALVEARTHTRSHLTAKLLGTIAEVAQAVQATHRRKRDQLSGR